MIITKSKLKILVNRSKVTNKIKEIFKNNKYILFKLKEARSLITIVLSLVLTLSNTDTTTMFCCSMKVFLCEVSI